MSYFFHNSTNNRFNYTQLIRLVHICIFSAYFSTYFMYIFSTYFSTYFSYWRKYSEKMGLAEFSGKFKNFINTGVQLKETSTKDGRRLETSPFRSKDL